MVQGAADAISLRRLVVLSILLTLGGLVLLLPSSPLMSQFAPSASSGSAPAGAFAVSRATNTDATSAIESMAGIGLIGMGLVLEFLSLFTDVGAGVPSTGTPSADKSGAKQQ